MVLLVYWKPFFAEFAVTEHNFVVARALAIKSLLLTDRFHLKSHEYFVRAAMLWKNKLEAVESPSNGEVGAFVLNLMKARKALTPSYLGYYILAICIWERELKGVEPRSQESINAFVHNLTMANKAPHIKEKSYIKARILYNFWDSKADRLWFSDDLRQIKNLEEDFKNMANEGFPATLIDRDSQMQYYAFKKNTKALRKCT